MNGYFLLTISLLVVLKIQSGVLSNKTETAAPGTPTTKIGVTGNKTVVGTTPSAVQTTTSKSVTTHRIHDTTTAKRNGAPALSDVGGGRFLFFVVHTLIHLFYLS